MNSSPQNIKRPFFSICIPQFNRTAFLIEACKTLALQTFKDFEVCISDDCSTDGLQDDLRDFLKSSGLDYRLERLERNLRYDGNLRAAIGMSRGQYCFLLGNDDALASPHVLKQLHDLIEELGPIGVAITNFEEFDAGRRVRRVKKTGIIGAGPQAAIENYRNVSFVSGVILNGDRARALATDHWDGSEMYQMYLSCRILAEGAPLLAVDRIAIRKDIQLENEEVDSFVRKPRLSPCPITERRHTFDRLGRLVFDSVRPFVEPASRQKVAERILWQLLVFTFPFWIFEFKRVQSFNYAAGICIGMRPRNITEGMPLSQICKFRIAILHFFVSLAGLLVPVGVFRRAYPHLHAFSKSNIGKALIGLRHVDVS